LVACNGNGTPGGNGESSHHLHGFDPLGQIAYFVSDFDEETELGVLKYLDSGSGDSGVISEGVFYLPRQDAAVWTISYLDTRQTDTVLFARNCTVDYEGCDLAEWSHASGETVIAQGVNLMVGHWTYSPDFGRLAFFTDTGLKVWDRSAGEVVAEAAGVDIANCHWGWSIPYYSGLFPSPDGTAFAFLDQCQGEFAQIRSLDVATGETTTIAERVYHSETSWSYSIESVGNGMRLIYLTEDLNFWSWDFSGEPQLLHENAVLSRGASRYHHRAVSPDGTRAISLGTGTEDTLWLVDLDTAAAQPLVEGDLSGTWLIYPDFERFAFRYNQTVALCDIEFGAQPESIFDADGAFVSCDMSDATFSADGQELIFACRESHADVPWTMQHYDIATGELNTYPLTVPIVGSSRLVSPRFAWGPEQNHVMVYTQNEADDRTWTLWHQRLEPATPQVQVSDATNGLATAGPIWAGSRLLYPECTQLAHSYACTLKLFDLNTQESSTLVEDMALTLSGATGPTFLLRRGDWLLTLSDWDAESKQGDLYMQSLSGQAAELLGSTGDIYQPDTLQMTPEKVFFVGSAGVEFKAFE